MDNAAEDVLKKCKNALKSINISIGGIISVLCVCLFSLLLLFSITAYFTERSENFDIININEQDQFLINPAYDVTRNNCSKACCSPTYGNPNLESIERNPEIIQKVRNGDYVPNRMYCNNNSEDAGCMCMTKEQAAFIRNRGGNI